MWDFLPFILGTDSLAEDIYFLSFTTRDHVLVRTTGAYYLAIFSFDIVSRGIIPLTTPTVYGLFVLESFHMVVSTRVAWALLCNGWGDLSALTFVGWQDAFIPILTGISEFTRRLTVLWIVFSSPASGWVQLFYAWRIKILCEKSRAGTIVAFSIIPVRLYT